MEYFLSEYVMEDFDATARAKVLREEFDSCGSHSLRRDEVAFLFEYISALEFSLHYGALLPGSRDEESLSLLLEYAKDGLSQASFTVNEPLPEVEL